MTAVETIAFILVAVGLIKLIVLVIKPDAWFGFARRLTGNTAMFKVVALILSAVILYYLLMELTIVQIFASMAFVTMLMWVALAPFKNELMETVSRNHGQDVLKRNWLFTLIWVVLALWVLKEIFT